jgi:GNAT superfamily N-acetyltransferase
MALSAERVRLKDGSEVDVRAIDPTDADALTEGLESLSPESRYRRFFAPKRSFSGRELEYLTAVDHHEHEALVAIEPDGRRGIGVARFIKDPADPASAEVAITVSDDWQGRGVGGMLLHRLAVRAVEEGVCHFTATVLETNDAIQELLRSVGPIRRRHLGGGVAELCVDLSVGDPCPAVLRGALQAAARGDLTPA